MATTSNDIANEAIDLMGWSEAVPVSGVAPTFDTSVLGQILSRIYQPVVAAIFRSFPSDCARKEAALAASGGVPPAQWMQEYAYPSDCVQILQLAPPTFTDPNNPTPIRWQVANDVIAGTQTKVIWSNLAGAVAIYSTAPSEAIWDASVRRAVVRELASELALAVAKPETAMGLEESAGRAGAGAMSRGET